MVYVPAVPGRVLVRACCAPVEHIRGGVLFYLFMFAKRFDSARIGMAFVVSFPEPLS